MGPRHKGKFTYSMLMASTGHSPTQTAQSTHASRSMVALLEAILMASLGQASRQDSQPVHFTLSTFAGITQPFPVILNIERPKKIQNFRAFYNTFL
jgi:hypothetical protein